MIPKQHLPCSKTTRPISRENLPFCMSCVGPESAAHLAPRVSVSKANVPASPSAVLESQAIALPSDCHYVKAGRRAQGAPKAGSGPKLRRRGTCAAAASRDSARGSAAAAPVERV